MDIITQYEDLLYSTEEQNLGLEERFKQLKNYMYNDHQILFSHITNHSLNHIEKNNQSYEDLLNIIG
jgi:plasmid replication initiation protein